MSFPALESKPTLTEYQSAMISEFFALSASRTSNGFGLNPLSYVEMVAYIQLDLSILPCTPSEFAEIMRFLDNKYLLIKHEKEKKSKEVNQSTAPTKPPPKR